MIRSDGAAHDLLGLELNNNWKVIEKISKLQGQTGSVFSVCYKIERNNEICFLKAFNFDKFRQNSAQGTKMIDALKYMSDAHIYERDLSDRCRNQHLDKIVTVKEADEIELPGYSFPLVPYLIFEMADGDVRKKMIFSGSLDVAWKLKSLHSIAVGLKQLHSIEISHQDLKPSNILIFGNESKIGDIGRSLSKNMDSPYTGSFFNGDYNYAPPEILYGFKEPDWMKRTYSTDSYLLGSLIFFYFTGISMTASLRRFLPDGFAWESWTGTFEDVKPYLLNAHANSLKAFSNCIPDEYLKIELLKILAILCHPYPERRSHPKNNLKFELYNMDRFITHLSILYKKAEYKLINQ